MQPGCAPGRHPERSPLLRRRVPWVPAPPRAGAAACGVPVPRAGWQRGQARGARAGLANAEGVPPARLLHAGAGTPGARDPAAVRPDRPGVRGRRPLPRGAGRPGGGPCAGAGARPTDRGDASDAGLRPDRPGVCSRPLHRLLSTRPLYQAERSRVGRVLAALHTQLPRLPAEAQAQASRLLTLREPLVQRFQQIAQQPIRAASPVSWGLSPGPGARDRRGFDVRRLRGSAAAAGERAPAQALAPGGCGQHAVVVAVGPRHGAPHRARG